MAARRHYYEVLGVPPDADSTAIKNAFRQLARRYYPDISTEPDAEQGFREMPSPVPSGPPAGRRLAALVKARAPVDGALR
jgi:hypothetical protein